MWLSSDQGGRQVAHRSGVYGFPFAGLPVLVPDDLGVHLLAAGGFREASPPQPAPVASPVPAAEATSLPSRQDQADRQ